MKSIRSPLRWLAPLAGATLVSVLAVSCDEGGSQSVVSPALAPEFTMGVGSASTLLGRATFVQRDPFRVRRNSEAWSFDLKANTNLDVAVQKIVFQPGGQSGWHSHPGPVFIQVVQGVMTFYDSRECTPIVKKAGEGFLDVGDRAHIARNESPDSAINIVTYFAPPGATLRIDQPQPASCPF